MSGAIPPDVGDLAIREETADDAPHVRAVHTTAFGDDRVPRLVAAIHATPAPVKPRGFVATLGGVIVGNVLISAARLDAPRRLVDVATLSPLGVLPEHQRRGIGTLLLAEAVRQADDSGVPLLFLEGDPSYYGPRGFVPAGPLGFRKPSLRIPDGAFQVARLRAYEPWMTGTLVYSEPFWAHDCVGLREVHD